MKKGLSFQKNESHKDLFLQDSTSPKEKTSRFATPMKSARGFSTGKRFQGKLGMDSVIF